MDWNNFFVPGSNQNYNFVPGGFPPAGGGTVYQNGQQNWQYYPTYNQNYISEPSSLQAIVPPHVSSTPYGNVFSHPSGDYREGNLGPGMVSTFHSGGMGLNETFNTPVDSLTSILSASSLTPTAGEFIPRSRNIQKVDDQGSATNTALNVSGGSVLQQQQEDLLGAAVRSSSNTSGADVNEFVSDSNSPKNSKSKTFHLLNTKSVSQWKDISKQEENSESIHNANEVKVSSVGNEVSFVYSAKSKYDSSSDSVSSKSNIRTVQSDISEKDPGNVDEPRQFRVNKSKSFGQGHDTSARKGSGRILQNRMGENMKGSNSRDSKNQGRQRLLAEAANFYTSASVESKQVDESSSSNTSNKSFDWQALRDGKNTNQDAYSGRNYNRQMGNRRENRTSQEYDNSYEGNASHEKEKNPNGGRSYYNQNDGIRSDRDRNDRREKSDRRERVDKVEGDDKGRNDRGEKNDRGDRNDKGERNNRGERNIPADRNNTGDKKDRVDRNDRGIRSDKGDRIENGDRIDRGDRYDKRERSDRRERIDRGERNDRGDRNNRGDRSGRLETNEWNDRSQRWDRCDRRDGNEKGDRNERNENRGERGIRNERDGRSNQSCRIGRQEGGDRSDRNDAGKYQKTFYSSRFSSRNSEASPSGRDIPPESNFTLFQNRARWSVPNQYPNEQSESENNFPKANSGRKYGSYVSREVSGFQNHNNISSKYENSNVAQNSVRKTSEDCEEKHLTIYDNTKCNMKLPQSEGSRVKKVYSGPAHYADDEASQRERLSDQLSRGVLECLVCCERVRQNDAVWSCSNCYHVLHFRCIKKWARSSKAESGWRCPACQNVTSKVPQEYRCFCGKMREPVWNRQDLPHSCGEVCGRSREPRAPELGPCVHRCTLLCHPGPCPPCVAQVNRECGCGKTTQIVSCGSSQPLLCEALCNKLLNCKLHSCTKTCHWGACGDCEEVVKQDCYCGKGSQEIPCTEETANVKHYGCKEVCARELVCANHKCTLVCHDGQCVQCELMPSRVAHCPCGKTPLGEDCQRVSCLDPVPTCGLACEKQLSCGQPGNYHRCQAECHTGPCPQCALTTFVKCRCGHMDREIDCKELTTKADDARCEKRCSKKRACGKHKCNQSCCIEVDHQCPLPCNHTLSCGQHRCEDLCHRGNCQPCWRTSFEELYCECGASVIFPPVPCGTRRPLCTQPCSRQHPCEHEALHTCHSEPTCPPCTVLMEKYCYGKHELRKAMPCHQMEFSCGMPCGLPLLCGRHKCILPCHKGSCVREGQPVCVQPCRITRQLCGHSCAAPCHEGPCPDTPCKETVRVTCECGHRSTTRPCYDQTKEYRRVLTALLASKMQDVQLGHSVDIADLGGPTARADSLKTLDCNEECKIIERNRRLAIGLQIRNPDLSNKLQPRYSEFIRQWGKKDPYFVSMVHDKLTELVQLAKQSKQKSRSYSFSSMNRDKRHFIHEYCEHFGCESQAYDPEPNRNVVATAQRDRAWLPSMSLLEVLQRESGQRKVPKPVTARTVDSKMKESPSGYAASQVKAGEGSSKPEKEKEKEKEKEVEIDYFEYTS